MARAATRRSAPTGRRFDHSTGVADSEFFYGIPGDQIITGDWNHDGTDTVGIWRESTDSFYLSDTNSTTIADYRFPYLDGIWAPVAGSFL